RPPGRGGRGTSAGSADGFDSGRGPRFPGAPLQPGYHLGVVGSGRRWCHDVEHHEPALGQDAARLAGRGEGDVAGCDLALLLAYLDSPLAFEHIQGDVDGRAVNRDELTGLEARQDNSRALALCEDDRIEAVILECDVILVGTQ